MRDIFTTNERENFENGRSIVSSVWTLITKISRIVSNYSNQLGGSSLLKPSVNSPSDTSVIYTNEHDENSYHDGHTTTEYANEAMKLFNLKAKLGENNATTAVKNAETTKTYFVGGFFDTETGGWHSRISEQIPTDGTTFHEDDPVVRTSFLKRSATTILLVLFSVFGVFANKAASIDLSLRSTISNAAPAVGNNISFTLWLKNEGSVSANNIVVKNTFPKSGLSFINHTGSTSFNHTSDTGIGLWNVATLAAGDSVSLEIVGEVIQRGLFFNIAEIQSINDGDTDTDSTPGDSSLNEDDITAACFSVPLLFYPGEQFTISLPSVYKAPNTVEWYRNGEKLTGNSADATVNADTSLTIKSIGNYTFTTTDGGCGEQGCCAQQVIAAPYGSIGNLVWYDKNDNGLQDVNEPGLKNIILELYPVGEGNQVPEEPIQKDTTNENGNYLFSNLLSGDYIVKIVEANLSDTLQISRKKDIGSDDTIDNDFNSMSGVSSKITIHIDSTGIKKNNQTIDAALYTPVGTIGNRVWNDSNNNGIQDNGETGVANAILELYKSNDTGTPDGAVVAKDTTNPDGMYIFHNLRKGSYVVKLLANTLPEGFTISPKVNIGVDDSLDSDFDTSTGLSPKVTLDPYNFNITPLNRENITIDAAVYSPLGTIGDYVWNDTDNDGIQDIEEAGVQGVTLELFAANNAGVATGNSLKTNTTDVNGHYMFSNLAEGDYVVKVVNSSLPEMLAISAMNDKGSNDALDSDFNATTGYSPKITINTASSSTKDISTIDLALHTTIDCPTLTISAIGGEICSGDTVFIKGVTGNNAIVKWYLAPNGGASLFTSANNELVRVFPTTTTTYYAQVEGLPTGCPTTRQPLIVTVNASPIQPSAPNNVDACTDETVNLNTHIINGTTSPGGIFEWHTTNLSSSPMVSTPSAVGAGTYYLFEKSGAGCYSKAKVLKVNIKNCSSLIDLSLSKSVNNLTPNVTDQITYTITVKNEGQNAATNVEIEDQMPTGLEFISGAEFSKSGDILTSTIASIAPGQTISLNYVAKVNLPGTKINFAQISKADQKDIDSTPGNASTSNEDDNSKVIITPVQPTVIADLSLDKSVNKSNVSIGEQVTYYITVINNGPANATNVEVEDTLPGSLEVVTVSGANHITVSGNLVKARFDKIDVGSTATFQIITNVMVSSGTIRNIAHITKSDQLDGDSIPGNGIDSGEDDTDFADIIVTDGVCNPPIPLIATSTPFICLGENITLTSVGCTGTVIWSNGSTGNTIIIAPITNTTYTAKCRLSNDCLGGNSNPINVTVNSIVPPVISSDATNNTICAGGTVKLSATSCNGSVVWSNGTTATSITVTPTISTTYTAICKTNSCVSNASSPLTITVNNSASAPVITASKTTICSGDAAVLTASGCTGTLSWSNGSTGTSIGISPIATGTYTVTCALSGCGNQTSAPVTISVLPAVSAPAIQADKDIICAGTSASLSATGCSGTLSWSNGVSGSVINVSPVITTTYEVTCNVGDCNAKTSKTITVKAQPAAPVIGSAKSQICAGEAVTLTAHNCEGNVIWSNGATTATVSVNPVITTSYTATCSVDGCISVPSSAVTITVSAITTPVITATKDLICKGGSSTLTVSSCAGNILWSSGQTSSSITVEPTVTSTYTVTCTSGDCGVTASKAITVNTIQPAPPVISASSTNLCISGEVTLTATGCSGIVLWSNTQTGTSIKVNVTSDIVFAAACKIDECESEKSNNVNITIGKIDKPTISADITTICSGDTIELISGGCIGSTVWSNGFTGNIIKVSPDSTTEYSAVCKQTVGDCSSEQSNKITITVPVRPAIPSVAATIRNICPATTVNLSSIIPATPSTPDGVFEFHVTSDRHSALLTSITQVSAGTYYLFEKSATGCYSLAKAIKAEIINCTIVPPIIDYEKVDVGIEIVGSKDILAKGEQLTYTITVKNNSVRTANNVHITNILPDGLTIISGGAGLTAVGSDSMIAVIGVLPGGASMTYEYVAKTTKAGIIRNTAKITGASQADPLPGNNISHWDVHCSSCQELCVAVALSADTTRQSNGSYDIAFTALVQNCGNVKLENVRITENLDSMFPSLVTYTIKQSPTVNAGSKLIPNESYNGSSNLSLTVPEGSELAAGITDTVRFVINMFPNGNDGPFSTNAVVDGRGYLSLIESYEQTSDVSNDGKFVKKNSSEPTVIRLFRSPGIGLAKSVSDTIRKENGSYDVTYKLIVKNNGSLPLTNVVLSDSLSKVFKQPASFTVIGTPTINAGSQLIVSETFNGVTDTKLTLPGSTLAIGQADTLRFRVNLQPDTLKLFSNTALVTARGTLGVGTEQPVTELSNAGTNPDTPGNNPTNLSLEHGNLITIEKPCIGIGLYVKDTVKLEDGSYNILFRAVIQNCGNTDLFNIQLADTLANTFALPVEAAILQPPTVSEGSQLLANTDYDGVEHPNLLLAGSQLAAGRVDTVKWVVNVKLHDNLGPFVNSVIVSGQTESGTTVSDISNDGVDPNPEGSAPTVITFHPLPDALIGIAKELTHMEKVEDNTYDITFKIRVKNYGKVDFNRVIVQDNLAVTFGDSVRIDSVNVTADAGFVANPNFTGRGSLINLLVDSLSTLPIHTTRGITLFTRVTLTEGKNSFVNTAWAVGKYAGNTSLIDPTDDSANGSNPDANLNGDPRDDSEPTPIDLSKLDVITPLGIAKWAQMDSSQNADKSFNLTYKFVIKNYGETRLTNVQLSDSLETVFSDFKIIGSPKLNAGSTLKLNPDFNGKDINTLLVADSSYLEPAAADTLELKMTFKIDIESLPLVYSNTAYGSARDSSKVVTDLSQEGLDPDPDGNNNPGNNNEPTQITVTEDNIAPEDTTIVIPEGFSPNSDGVGDRFVIKGINNTTRQAKIYIYNRWGVLVYKNEDYGSSEGWDGKANNGLMLLSDGMHVPDGTYYYVLEVPDLVNTKPKVGFITIVK